MGPPATVHFFMSNQFGFLCKAPITVATHVQILTSVQSHVYVQVAFFTKGFFANTADVGHLSRTGFPMSGLVAALLTGQTGLQLPSKLHFLACIAGTWVAGAGERTSFCQNISTISRSAEFLRGAIFSIADIPNWEFPFCLGAFSAT